MTEMFKYGTFRKKLENICDENKLTYHFDHSGYPITLTISSITPPDEQLSMFDDIDGAAGNKTGPDAAIVFAYIDGDLTYKISDTFSIDDALFNKLKNLHKKMHAAWLQYFNRELIRVRLPGIENIPDIDAAPQPDTEALEEPEDLEDMDDLEDAEASDSVA